MKRQETSFLKKGALVLSERPFVFVLNSSQKLTRCDHCFQKSELLTCLGCNSVRYCDKICQKKGWYFHKRECGNIKRITPKILPDAARLLARIIYKLDKGGAREQCFYSPRQFRVFMDLMSHYNELKNDSKRMEHFESLNVVLQAFFENDTMPNSVELLRMYGKMIINTFSILDGEMQSIGSGMYLGASIIDHSCVPNAVAVFEGTTLKVRTLVDLDYLDWDRIRISYIDLMRFPAERQQDLLENYYFMCDCSRCLDALEVGLMNSVLCQNSMCQKTILNGVKEPQAVCPSCGSVQNSGEKIKEAVSLTDEQLSLMKNVAYIDACRMCLRRIDALFDPMNLRRVRILDAAMDCSIDLGMWEAAVEYGQQLITPFKRYYGSSHPVTGVLLLKLGKLQIHLERISEARKLLKDAADILTVTHGESHTFIREELLPYLRLCCA